jgi:high affinity Mn2+ porin
MTRNSWLRSVRMFRRPHHLGLFVLLNTLLAYALAVPPVSAQNAKPEDASAQASRTPTVGKKALLPYELGLQVTLIDQNLFRFHSPYTGPNSLLARNENEKSDTYTVYAGVRLTRGLEVFLNPEMARGNGIGEALGLAGFTNGDVIRNPTLGMEPYLGRYFVRYTLAAGKGEEKIEPGENQIAGMRPTQRLVFTAGKFGANDIFDMNSYANSTRTQFMNWALLNNAAYDYAADTRGYSRGYTVEWIHPDFAVRLGLLAMPLVANGPDLAQNLNHARGEQIELETHPTLLHRRGPMIVRLLAYRNIATMGSYRDTLTSAQQNGTIPDIMATRRPNRIKYGFGLNVEQPLADDGATGVFGRYGWDDGATESFAYTEVDRTLALGGQLSGRRWHRTDDRLALAFVQNDLAGVHKEYLAAGGLGFLLGDGKLNYGSEQIVETYYSFQVSKPLALSLDYQWINHPGYNRDRGPVSVLSARAHLEF